MRTIIICIGFLFTLSDRGYNQYSTVDLQQHLGQYLPGDVPVVDENGHVHALKEFYNGKPLLLTFVYYHCPDLCIPYLQALSETIDKMEITPGRDFTILTISFDPREKPAYALQKKREIFNGMQRQIPFQGWRFLTASPTSLNLLLRRAGVSVKRNKDGFLHPTALVVLSPQGKITRYILGNEFLPLEIRFALMEARKGILGAAVAKVVKFCFNYDPSGRRYVLNVVRIAMLGIFMGSLVLGGTLFITGRRKNQ